MEILGWSQAIRPEHNRTCHLIITDGSPMAKNACWSRVPTSGQVHRDPPEYAPYKCGNCVKSKAFKLYEEGLIMDKKTAALQYVRDYLIAMKLDIEANVGEWPADSLEPYVAALGKIDDALKE
jgi:hypothetical protein